MESFPGKSIGKAETLEAILPKLFERVKSLEETVAHLKKERKDIAPAILEDKENRLDGLRHMITETNDRMERPYVVSAELLALMNTLEILAEAGDTNSIILEGEPGTGKTQWAYSEVGQELREGNDVGLVHIRVKETMNAQDLLYSVDDVRRLSDAQASAEVPKGVQKEADQWKQLILSGEVDPATDEAYQAFREKMKAITELGEGAKDLDYLNYIDLGPLGEAIYQSGKGKKVYLLIDEIEKGREELMTGMLDEIENLTFTIAETGTVVKGDKKNMRIVITTNTEDSDKIPSSFRRRSLYHYIKYPDREDMAMIVQLNFPDIQQNLLDYALTIFYQYHEEESIEKKPSTPELLAWIRVLLKNFDGEVPEGIPHKEVLLKYIEDHAVSVATDRGRESRAPDIDFNVSQWLEGEEIGVHVIKDQEHSWWSVLEDIAVSDEFPLEWLLEKDEKYTYSYAYVPPIVLKALAKHHNWRVRREVAQHQNTDLSVVRKLLYDEDEDVSRAAKQTLEDEEG